MKANLDKFHLMCSIDENKSEHFKWKNKEQQMLEITER